MADQDQEQEKLSIPQTVVTRLRRVTFLTLVTLHPVSVHKTRSDVAEDQRVVILTGLVTNNPRIAAASQD